MKKVILALLGFLVLSGCNNNGMAPVAKAGNDRTVQAGETVTLDGTASHDGDGDKLDYTWAFDSKPEESTAEISDATAAIATFVPDVRGEYVVKLTVDDGEFDKTDTVTLTCLSGTYLPGKEVPVLVFFDDAEIHGWQPEETIGRDDYILRLEYPSLVPRWDAGEIFSTELSVDMADAFHPERFEVVEGEPVLML